MRASSSRHASSICIVCAPGAPSSSLANEQKRHDATHTLVTSMRMFRLKYVRSPANRSRASLASRPTATTSGSRKRARPSSNDRRSPARSFWTIASIIDFLLYRHRLVDGLHRAVGANEYGNAPGAADEPCKLPLLYDVRRLHARPLTDAGELAVGERKSAFAGDVARKLVGAEAERHLRELEPAARPVDANARGGRPRHTSDGDRAEQLQACEVALGLVQYDHARRPFRRRCVDADLVADFLFSHAVGQSAQRQ